MRVRFQADADLDARIIRGLKATAAGRTSAGVVVVPKHISLGIVVEELLLIWAASQAEEWHNRLVWIPL